MNCDKQREEAREYFKPLTLEDINKNDWDLLLSIVKKHMEWKNNIEKERNPMCRNYTMKLGKSRFRNTNDTNLASRVWVKLDDYTEREGISFYNDGFIGFAGWADSENLKVFTDSFCEWVDILKNQRFGIPIPSRDTIIKSPKIKTDITVKAIDSLKMDGMVMSAVGIPAWEVEELPETAKLGEIRVMQGKTYIYSGNKHWDKVYNPDTLLREVKDIVKNSEDCKLKTDLIQILF